VNDSIVYKTDKGRLVYGGGGITPDHFVALDTAGNTRYLTRLLTSNSLAEYAVSYFERNEDMILAMGRIDFISSFEVDANMLREIVDAGTSNDVTFNRKQFDSSREKIQLYVKAFIGRRAWNNDGFYPIINRQNSIYQKALELFDQAAILASKQ
jgi:carboxyl-terminal processing protease